MDLFEMIALMSFEEYEKRIYKDRDFTSKVFTIFSKQDDPLLSTTQYIWQPLYGEAVWSMVYRQPNLFNALPKIPWARDGVRVLTADPAVKVAGMEEEGEFPESVKPDYYAYVLDSKWLATKWDVTEKARQHAARNEGINLDASLRSEMADIHVDGLNDLLLVDASFEADEAGGDRFEDPVVIPEPIDRLISSVAEEGEYGGGSDHWFDCYGEDIIDREADTTFDSIVLFDAENDRVISLELLDELVDECEDAGANPATSFLLTGRDTRTDIAALQYAMLRYSPTQKVEFTVNGVRTARGVEAGMSVASYRDYPILVDHVPKDGSSRVYFIDHSKLKLKVMLPTQYLTNRNWLGLNAIKDINAYLTVFETECVDFGVQGKLRDLA